MPTPMRRNLRPLLDPASFAIVGASADLNRIGGISLAALIGHGFPRERILLVNPRHSEIQGIACHARIENLPFAPDLAIVAVPAGAVVPALEALDGIGARAAVIFAAGFGEDPTEEGARLEGELRGFLDRSDMIVAGPNTIGLANIRERTSACFVTTLGEALPIGPLALIGQSGNSVSMMAASARDLGIGMSYFVSTGNETGVEFSEYLAHFAQDPETGVVAGYCEQLRDGPRFIEAAIRLRTAGKPLFVTKVGRSEKAREAAVSHTGAMAGDASVYAAAFRQLGIGQGRDPAEVLDMVRLWRCGAKVTQPGVAIVSLSGAGCAFLSDMFADAGVPVPTLPAETQAALRRAIPSYGMVSNPVDLTGNVINDMNHLRSVLDALSACATVDCILIYIMGTLLDAAAPILHEVRARSDKLIVALDPSDAVSAPALRQAGVEVFEDGLRAVSSIAAYLRWAGGRAGPLWFPADPVPSVRVAEGGGRLLDEHEAKQLLAGAGVSCISEEVAADAAAAVAAAERLGYPVVVKLLSPDVAHKSDIGGVVLGLADGDAVRGAFDAIVARAKRHRPDARIAGVLVQRQAAGEGFLIGATRDPTFGAVLTVGFGGVATELYRDVALRLLPIDEHMAEEMIGELICAPLLDGYRGQPRRDRAALVDAMVRVSALFLARPDIAEIEVNPLLVGVEGEGSWAVDALVRLNPPPKVEGDRP